MTSIVKIYDGEQRPLSQLHTMLPLLDAHISVRKVDRFLAGGRIFRMLDSEDNYVVTEFVMMVEGLKLARWHCGGLFGWYTPSIANESKYMGYKHLANMLTGRTVQLESTKQLVKLPPVISVDLDAMDQRTEVIPHTRGMQI